MLFLATHLLFDATILLGPWAYNNIPIMLHKYYLAQIFVPVVIIGFLGHFVLAWRKIPFNYKNAMTFGEISFRSKHGSSILWIVQMFSGMILLLLGVLHFWDIVTSGLTNINAITSSERAALSYYHVFYYLFMTTALTHAGIGIYRLWMKWFGKARKSVLIICLIISLGYAVLSIFSIQRFHNRGEIQILLKKQIKNIQTEYYIDNKSERIIQKKKHFQKTMKKLKLQYNKDLFRFLGIETTEGFYEYLEEKE